MDIKDVLFCFVFETFFNRSIVYKKNVNWLAMLVIYFLINKYFGKKKLLEWLKWLTNRYNYPTKKVKFLNRLFITICDIYSKTPLKLTHIARETIRNRVDNISKSNLKKLNLPEHLAYFVRESIFLDKKEYEKIYGNFVKIIFNEENDN